MGKSKFSYKKVIVIKLNRFEVVSGKYIEEISGQSRIGYSMSDTTDFYDMIEWSKKGGYQGSIISFYDYNNGKIYEPFQKQRNVLYGPPVYLKNSFWFLQGDYNSGKITLFRYLPDKIPELIIQFNIADVDLYNLRIIGEDIYILSAWVEEGWDDDNNCATEEYRYYEKMIVRDFKGNVLSETIGSLQQHPDGTWWIS